MKPVAQFIPIWLDQERDIRRLPVPFVSLSLHSAPMIECILASMYACVWVFGNVILQHYPNTHSYRASLWRHLSNDPEGSVAYMICP